MRVSHAPEDLPVLLLCNMNQEWEEPDRESAKSTNSQMAYALNSAGHPVEVVEITDGSLEPLLSPYSPAEKIIFNQCESIPGMIHSEHEAVRIIESMGFTYTGSKPETLRLAEDKTRVKQILESFNIPTPAWKLYSCPSAHDWNMFPAIVKTSLEHCSISLDPGSVVMNRKELELRIEYILDNFNQPAIVEVFIDGREFHVPLCGNGKVQMMPVVEMDFSAFNDIHDRICTYDSKFDPSSPHYNKIESRIPAPLNTVELINLEKICLNAYHAIGCRDYARLDVRELDGLFYVLDVNPNPDLDIDASMAYSAAHCGISYPDMMSYLVNLAAYRHPVFNRI
jgi:D-alanine-D-alanine ligase